MPNNTDPQNPRMDVMVQNPTTRNQPKSLASFGLDDIPAEIKFYKVIPFEKDDVMLAGVQKEEPHYKAVAKGVAQHITRIVKRPFRRNKN